MYESSDYRKVEPSEYRHGLISASQDHDWFSFFLKFTVSSKPAVLSVDYK